MAASIWRRSCASRRNHRSHCIASRCSVSTRRRCWLGASNTREEEMAGKVGFIGLGAMGGPMARNLIKADVPLVVHDIDAAKTAKLNAEVAASATEVASRTERTILIVETTEQAQSVIAGAQGIIQSAKPGHIVICMSTIDPFAARALAEELAAKGIAMVDAPVSGGPGRAQSGELSAIVGR